MRPGLCGACMATVWRPEVDGIGGTPDLRVSAQRFRRRGMPPRPAAGCDLLWVFQTNYALEAPSRDIRLLMPHLGGYQYSTGSAVGR